MPILTSDNFVSTLKEFVALQSVLQDELFKSNTTVRDWKYLTDLPRHGCVHAQGAKWKYSRHGLGVRFENEDGIVVDVHNHLLEKGVVDAHRMSEFIVSKHGDSASNLDLYSECEERLRDVEMIGVVGTIDEKERSWKFVAMVVIDYLRDIIGIARRGCTTTGVGTMIRRRDGLLVGIRLGSPVDSMCSSTHLTRPAGLIRWDSSDVGLACLVATTTHLGGQITKSKWLASFPIKSIRIRLRSRRQRRRDTSIYKVRLVTIKPVEWHSDAPCSDSYN